MGLLGGVQTIPYIKISAQCLALVNETMALFKRPELQNQIHSECHARISINSEPASDKVREEFCLHSLGCSFHLSKVTLESENQHGGSGLQSSMTSVVGYRPALWNRLATETFVEAESPSVQGSVPQPFHTSSSQPPVGLHPSPQDPLRDWVTAPAELQPASSC